MSQDQGRDKDRDQSRDKDRDYYYSGDQGGEKLWTRGFIAFICLNIFIFLGFDVLLPTLTVYLEEHGHSRDAIGRIFSFFTLAAIIMRMLAPRLVVLLRPFVIVRLGLLVAGLAVFGYYFAHGAVSASLARFFHGLGFGVTSTVLMALAAQTVPTSRMAQGMGFLGLGTILTLAVGPSFGIWLRDGFGYLVLFSTVTGFYICGLLWTMRMPDLALPAPPAGQPKPRLVFFSRLVWAPSALMFMTGISISAVAIYLALYFKEAGLPYTGWFFGLTTIGILVSRVFAGRVQDRHGHRVVVGPAIFSMLAAVTLIPHVRDMGLLALSAVCWGISTGAIFPNVQALAFNSVQPHQRTAVASSLFNAFDVGIGAGSIFLGVVCERAATYRAAFLGATVNCIIFLCFYLVYYFVFHPPSERKSKPLAGPASETA